MARPDKVAMVTEVRERLEASNATVLTEYRGLTVSQLARLRAELRDAGAEYKVLKNTLTRIAAREAGFEIPDDLLTGPTAVTFCGEDPAAAAKVLRSFSRQHPHLVVKGGILEGELLDATETMKLADLASRGELLAALAGMMQATVAKPARLALATLSRTARLFAALADKREESGESPGAPGTSEVSPAASTDAPTGSPETAAQATSTSETA